MISQLCFDLQTWTSDFISLYLPYTQSLYSSLFCPKRPVIHFFPFIFSGFSPVVFPSLPFFFFPLLLLHVHKVILDCSVVVFEIRSPENLSNYSIFHCGQNAFLKIRCCFLPSGAHPRRSGRSPTCMSARRRWVCFLMAKPDIRTFSMTPANDVGNK